MFKPEADERPALLAGERCYVPPYFGPGGWPGRRIRGHTRPAHRG
jgi:hypothetical protein